MILRSTLLFEAGFSCHGFTTREGGISEGPFASLNFSTTPGDRADHVEGNLQILADQLGRPREAIRSVKQIHSDRVLVIDDRTQDTASLEADALLSFHPSLVVGVKTADCVPLLLADPFSHAVAAIHAGWRGVVAEILPKTIRLLRQRHPQASPLLAIGPHIQASAFQVGPEVASLFPSHHRPDPQDETRFFVDLQATLIEQAQNEGLSPSQIDSLGLCTIRDPQQRFFSHRASKAVCGRMFNFIAPPETPSLPLLP